MTRMFFYNMQYPLWDNFLVLYPKILGILYLKHSRQKSCDLLYDITYAKITGVFQYEAIALHRLNLHIYNSVRHSLYNIP